MTKVAQNSLYTPSDIQDSARAAKVRSAFRIAFSVATFAVGMLLALHYPDANKGLGESGATAMSLLRHHTIADPYLIPSGPTAHVSPLLTFYLAFMFTIFGPDSLPARIALSAVGSACYATATYLALGICRSNKWAFWSAAGLAVIFPIFIYSFVVDSRQWDQPFSCLIILVVWTRMLRGGEPTGKDLFYLALICALGSLLSPGLLPVFFCALGVTIWRRRRQAATIRDGLLCVAVFAAILVPWGIRNEISLGKFILTRSDFPLEFAIGNAPGSDGTSEGAGGSRYHPHDSKPAAMEIARVGEVAYMNEMHDIAVKEVQNDPIGFVTLTATRIFYTLLPPPRMILWYPILGAAAGYLLFLLGALHVAALAVTTRQMRLYSVMFSVLPVAPYWITHITLRYWAVIYFPTIIVIAWAIARFAPPKTGDHEDPGQTSDDTKTALA